MIKREAGESDAQYNSRRINFLSNKLSEKVTEISGVLEKLDEYFKKYGGKLGIGKGMQEAIYLYIAVIIAIAGYLSDKVHYSVIICIALILVPIIFGGWIKKVYQEMSMESVVTAETEISAKEKRISDLEAEVLQLKLGQMGVN